MDRRKWVVVVVAFAIGCVYGSLVGMAIQIWVFSLPKTTPQQAIEDHWKVVNRYRDHIRDNANEENFEGLSGIREPFNPMLSLEALVQAGELEHLDLILPTVHATQKFNRHWMTATWDNPDYVHVTGNHFYVAYETKGQQPVHLNLWIKRGAEATVQKLIQELEEMAKEELK